MDIDLPKIRQDMERAIQNSVKGAWERIRAGVEHYMERKANRLNILAQLRLEGVFSDEEFEYHAKDEERLMRNELRELNELNEALIKRAARAAMQVFCKAVNKKVDV